MTVVLMFSVVPKTGSPFVMIAADSLATSDNQNFRDERAKKIFDAGNALMSTSGNVTDEYREEFAYVLRQNQGLSLKTKITKVYQTNIDFLKEYDFSMVVGLAQFDKAGNPQLALCGVSPKNQAIVGPHTSDKNKPEAIHFYYGEKRTERIEEMIDELNTRINTGNMYEGEIKEAAQIFISEVADIYPNTVNNIMQTKILYYK
ncbi:MAG: hypothetical protein ACQEV0_08445 [Bacillota bacterium]